MSEVPTLENEARSKASHDLPERSTKYLAGVGLFRVVQKLIPTTRATTKTPYKALSSTVNPQEYEKKDTQRAWPTEPRRIKRWTTFTYMTLFCDLVMTLLPVIFLGESVVMEYLELSLMGSLVIYSIQGTSDISLRWFQVEYIVFRSQEKVLDVLKWLCSAGDPR